MIRATRALTLPAALLAAGLLLTACASDKTTGGADVSNTAGAAAREAEPLAGSGWNLASYALPGGEQVPAATQPEVGSLSFAEDGSVAGSTGCNRFAGTYTQDGQALAINLGPVTRKACVGPVQQQEAAVLAALPGVSSFTRSETDLQLRNAGGEILLTYTPGISALAGSSWVATGINNGKGAIESNAATGKVTAEFGADGTMSGSAGCNSYSAPYTTVGSNGLDIGPAAVTMMACDDPVVTATEQAYLKALDQVATYAFDGNTLTLRDLGGAMMVTYAQAPAASS